MSISSKSVFETINNLPRYRRDIDQIMYSNYLSNNTLSNGSNPHGVPEFNASEYLSKYGLVSFVIGVASKIYIYI